MFSTLLNPLSVFLDALGKEDVEMASQNLGTVICQATSLTTQTGGVQIDRTLICTVREMGIVVG